MPVDRRPIVEIPERLYKYAPLDVVHKDKRGNQTTGFDAVKDILVNNQIYYSDPNNFNDPFEFQRVYVTISEKARNAQIINSLDDYAKEYKNSPQENDGEIIETNFNQIFDELEFNMHMNGNVLNRMGYLSLTTTNDNLLMWAHYADNHKGVCIKFNGTHKDPFYSKNGVGRIMKVDYGNELAIVEQNTENKYITSLVKMSRKSECWKYENEYRVFNVSSDIDSTDGQGNHSFNSRLADEVYLGCRATEDTESKIIKIIQSTPHKIKLFKMNEKKKPLKLVPEEISF